jgi:HEAT repeat protein
MLENDPSELVQVTAAAGLGRFVLLGELEEISERSFAQAISSLQKKDLEKPHKNIRQEILKSLAYTGNREINKEIQSAMDNPDPSWQLAGVITMGRTADDRWETEVLKAMDSKNSAIQEEAVKAAGELELESARIPFLEMAESGIPDLELRLHVIWALAKIGGEDVKETLTHLLEEADDDEEISVIEMALDHLEFSEELPDLDI